MDLVNKKKLVLTLGITLMFLVPVSISTTGSNIVKLENNEMISYDYSQDNELLVTFNMQGIIEDQIVNDYGTFTTLDIADEGFLGYTGRPQLPVVNCLFAVPTSDVSFQIENSIIAESNDVGKVYPAQSPQTDDEQQSEFIIDEEFYQQDIQYPNEISKFVSTGKIRDITFVKFEFYPVQYNPKQEIATFYDEITIKLTWDGEEDVDVEPRFYEAPYFKFYSNVFKNWEGFLDHTNVVEPLNNPLDDGCDYLIITHPNFYSEIVELANWKNSKGFMTKVVDTSVTGTTSTSIKNYIKNAYDTWDPRPSYFLLVGDAELIPTSASGTDLYYATVDGTDYFPDMFHGRIPVDTVQEAEIVVDKILTYEQTPPSSASFYENFVVAAYFQDDENNGYETRRFVRTSEEVRDYLMSIGYTGERIYCTESYINPTHYNNGYYGNGEPLPLELLRPAFAWDGDANDIINAIQSGIFILNHRDHGSEDGWGDPYFVSSHVAGLTNGELLPVVFSINCLTGRFDGYECFAEKFLRKDGGGAVAVFGATRVSYSGYNDFLCRGFYDAQWPDFDTEVGTNDPMYTLGELLNYGKVYMTETWGDPWGYEDYTFELFHVFGDPTMEIWSAQPEQMDVTYTFVGSNIQINVESGGSPISGALVCLSQESGFYAKGYTDSGGDIIIDTTGADILEEVNLVASYHNHRTYYQAFILNQIPEIPQMPDGPTVGKPFVDMLFTTSTVDADGDKVWYKWRWGDGAYSEWLGPFDSGQTASATHQWSSSAYYQIRVMARDEYGQETDWSEPLTINIQKSRSVNSFFLRFIQRYIDQFPILKNILGL